MAFARFGMLQMVGKSCEVLLGERLIPNDQQILRIRFFLRLRDAACFACMVRGYHPGSNWITHDAGLATHSALSSQFICRVPGEYFQEWFSELAWGRELLLMGLAAMRLPLGARIADLLRELWWGVVPGRAR